MTREQLQDWRNRVRRVLDEIEHAEGDAAPGTYPSDVSVTTHLAWKALDSATRAKNADAAFSPSDGKEQR